MDKLRMFCDEPHSISLISDSWSEVDTRQHTPAGVRRECTVAKKRSGFGRIDEDGGAPGERFSGLTAVAVLVQ